MWVVLKYKSKEYEILKNSFSKVLGNSTEYYKPKIKYEKYINNKLKVFEKSILENYLICRNPNFKYRNIISLLKSARGLQCFLSAFELNQKEIEKFVKLCKSNEDSAGYLSQNFFDITTKTKAKFISGPFTQMIFDILEDKGKKIKILINNINLTINKNPKNLLYS